MATSAILFSSLKALAGQSVLCKALAYLHANPYGTANSITCYDTVGLSTGNIDTILGTTITANSLDSIYFALPSQAAKATNKVSWDAIAGIDSRIKSARRGSVNNVVTTGTCESNSTTTNIVLAAATASTVDDYYNGMYIKTTVGGVATYHYITNYTGTSRICEVADTGSAVTTTSTYIVYTQPYVFVVGDSSSYENASRVAWTTLFPDALIPPIISLMGGYGTGFQPHSMVTQTATSAAAASLTHTSNFTASKYNKGTWYVAIESATVGAGQIKRILSNTASVLTIEPWDIVPTAAIVYQICSGPEFALYEQYLKYAIMTYLSVDNATTQDVFQNLLDKFNVLPSGGTTPAWDASLLKLYADRGKAVVDCVNAGFVTA